MFNHRALLMKVFDIKIAAGDMSRAWSNRFNRLWFKCK